MLRKLLPVIVVNVLLIILFIVSNLSLWNNVNGSKVSYDNGTIDAYLITSHWGPIGINAPHYSFNNSGFAMAAGTFGTIILHFGYSLWL